MTQWKLFFDINIKISTYLTYRYQILPHCAWRSDDEDDDAAVSNFLLCLLMLVLTAPAMPL